MIPPVGICLFGAAGGFGGDCPPFACMGLQASCSAVPRSPRVPVCFRACVRVTLAAHGRFLQSPAPCLGVCLCLLAFPHLSISIHISSITITLSLSPFSACDLSGSEFFPRGLLLLHPHGCSEGGQEGKAGERDPMGCCLTPPSPQLHAPGRNGEGQQGTKREDEDIEDLQESPCRWLRPPPDLRGQHNPQKRWGIWSKPPRETRRLPSGSSRVPKPLPRPYPAKPAEVRVTAEPPSTQINRHTRACTRGPTAGVVVEPLVPLARGRARAEPAGHTLPGCYRAGTRAPHPKRQQPDATVTGTASGSSRPLLPTAPRGAVRGRGAGLRVGSTGTLLCEKFHS